MYLSATPVGEIHLDDSDHPNLERQPTAKKKNIYIINPLGARDPRTPLTALTPRTAENYNNNGAFVKQFH